MKMNGRKRAEKLSLSPDGDFWCLWRSKTMIGRFESAEEARDTLATLKRDRTTLGKERPMADTKHPPAATKATEAQPPSPARPAPPRVEVRPIGKPTMGPGRPIIR